MTRRVLRHVSPAFAEDPLRVLRVARFAARFDFSVADDRLMFDMDGLTNVLQLRIADLGNDVRISFADQSVILLGVDDSQLLPDHFFFV